MKLQSEARASVECELIWSFALNQDDSKIVNFSALAVASVARLSAHKFSFIRQNFLKCHLWAEGTIK